MYIRRIAGEKFNDHYVMKSVRIMVWGCIHSGFFDKINVELLVYIL